MARRRAEDDGDPIEVVLSKNEKRRKHLTGKQKAFVGARMQRLQVGRPRRENIPPDGEIFNSCSLSSISEILHASERQISRAVQILNSGNEEIRAKVEGARAGYVLGGRLLSRRPGLPAHAWGGLSRFRETLGGFGQFLQIVQHHGGALGQRVQLL